MKQHRQREVVVTVGDAPAARRHKHPADYAIDPAGFRAGGVFFFRLARCAANKGTTRLERIGRFNDRRDDGLDRKMLAYHYTLASRLLDIVESREIRVSKHAPKGWGIYASWFSTNSFFDYGKGFLHRNSGRPFIMSMDEQAETFGLARIGVHLGCVRSLYQASVYGWISRESAMRYAMAATNCDANPAEWRISMKSVGAQDWRCVEVFHDGQWVEATPESVRPLLTRFHAFMKDYDAVVEPLIERYAEQDFQFPRSNKAH